MTGGRRRRQGGGGGGQVACGKSKVATIIRAYNRTVTIGKEYSVPLAYAWVM